MNFRSYYQYSWFSNLSYIEWGIANTIDQDEMINAARDDLRVPDRVAANGGYRDRHD